MTAPITVLLIEDNPIDVGVIEAALAGASRYGRETFVSVGTRSLAEGLARLRAGGVDVVLLDLHLPDSHGLDTLSAVRGVTTEVPIVVQTAVADEDAALLALQGGAQDYLLKEEIDARSLARALRYAIERQRTQVALLSLSFTDELTGLHNRRGFTMLAQQELALLGRQKRNALLLFVDLDRFKEVNDTHGHLEGDAALVAVAELLRNTFRRSDIIGRVGGDEFLVLVADTRERSDDLILTRLRERVAAENASGRRPYALALSVGMAEATPETTGTAPSLDALMAVADAALYEEKRRKARSRE
jgi:diguanylate cyclase (GGDEF)-like protein